MASMRMEEEARIQCVVFDAVGTLFHPDPPVAEVYQSVAARYGGQLSLEDIGERFRQVMAARPDSFRTSEVLERQFWKNAVEQVVGPVNDPQACFEELYEHFARSSAWRWDPDAIPTIQTLQAQGIAVAIASNFDERLHRLLEGLPELGSLAAVQISSQIGWRKPHRRFYELLIQTVGLPAREILMVGDDRELDILPAQDVGMAAVHLIRSEACSSHGSANSIRSLPDVFQWCGIDE